MSGRELGRLREIRREVAAIKATFAPDLVHANGVGPSLLIHLQTADAWAAPWVLTLQQELMPSQLSPGESLLHRALSSAAWVAACSEAVLTQARELAPEITSRSSVIRNTVNAPGPSPTRTREWNRLFCIGRLIPATREGHLVLAQSVDTDTGHVGNTLQIPAGAIRHIRHLHP